MSLGRQCLGKRVRTVPLVLTLAQVEAESVKQSGTQPPGKPYPPDVFERVTDLLAELLLEDVRMFPSLTASKPIDRASIADNTSVLA